MSSVLIVEDDPRIRANLLYQAQRLDLDAVAVGSAEEAMQQLEKGEPDLLLLDVRLPGASGVDLVRDLAAGARLPATVIVSGEASISETVEALRLGVHDFIEKPFSPERLERSIRNTLDHSALKREVARLECELGATTEILGASAPMQELRQRIAQVAPTDARVLIRGESGTGKELVANAVHWGSARVKEAFIKINCAAIPAHLIEDELFGHARGAFTDARTSKPGLFEEADGGTLFLDEIGDMEPQLQTRLLRVLEDGMVRRIGETRDREVDVRVIAATHADLQAAVELGTFREDLYFRLAHLPLDVPPLRDRTGDVRLLFDHFVEHYWRRHRMRPRRIESAVFVDLEAYSWPGNVRELRSLCERLVVFGGDPITPDLLPERYRRRAAPVTDDPSAGDPPEGSLALRAVRRSAEKRHIEEVLKRTGGNVAAAARLLEVHRTHLHQRITDLGVDRPR